MDKILERFGISYSDLSGSEKETLNGWMETLSRNVLTLESVRAYILAMKDSVEQELTQTTHNSKQDIFLKARLRNYLLLEAYLSTPEKAQKAIEQQLSSMGKKS